MTPNSPLSIPSTTRAWQFTRTGAPRSILTFNEHAPIPQVTTSHLLIRIQYSTLNGGSATILSIPTSFRRITRIPGNEFAGTIVAVGPSYTRKHGPGTRVFGTITRAAMARGRGVLTDYMLVHEDEVVLVPVPEGLPMHVAAGLSGCGSTAVSMCLRAGIKGGERVLLYGASGGVGSLVLQVLKNFGVKEVVAVCSKRNIDFVKGLGADEVLDYTAAPIVSQLVDQYKGKPFDIVMDTVGIQALYANSPSFLEEDGIFINVGAMVNGPFWGIWLWLVNANLPVILGGIPRRYIMFSNEIGTDQLNMLAHWAEEGKIKVPVEDTFELEEVLDAFDLIQSGRVRGKIRTNVCKEDESL